MPGRPSVESTTPAACRPRFRRAAWPHDEGRVLPGFLGELARVGFCCACGHVPFAEDGPRRVHEASSDSLAIEGAVALAYVAQSHVSGVLRLDQEPISAGVQQVVRKSDRVAFLDICTYVPNELTPRERARAASPCVAGGSASHARLTKCHNRALHSQLSRYKVKYDSSRHTTGARRVCERVPSRYHHRATPGGEDHAGEVDVP